MMSQPIADLLLQVWESWKRTSPVREGRTTQEQYRMLRTLESEGPQRVNGLASKVGCTPSTASIALKRLERAGVVTRSRSATDERVVKVALTPQGRKVLSSWRERQLGALSSMFDVLTRGEREELQRMLEKVVSGRGDA
jgi:MarR family transcriptional regulator, organic hydroperoxide resistance regulator